MISTRKRKISDHMECEKLRRLFIKAIIAEVVNANSPAKSLQSEGMLLSNAEDQVASEKSSHG
jgi:hypothetical protein